MFDKIKFRVPYDYELFNQRNKYKNHIFCRADNFFQTIFVFFLSFPVVFNPVKFLDWPCAHCADIIIGLLRGVNAFTIHL